MEELTVPLDLRDLLAAAHSALAAELAREPDLAHDPAALSRALDTIIRELMPDSLDDLARIASSHPALWQRPLPLTVFTEIGSQPSGQRCLALGLAAVLRHSLTNAAQRESALAPGELPGLLEALQIAPLAGPTLGLRRIEQGALADLDEWLARGSPTQLAEDVMAALDQIACAWLPDPDTTRAWFDLACTDHSRFLAENPVANPDGDDISAVECLRSHLYDYLCALLEDRVEAEASSRPELAAAFALRADQNGTEAQAVLSLVLPDPAFSAGRLGLAGDNPARLAAALCELACAGATLADAGYELAGSAWRLLDLGALDEPDARRARRLIAESGSPLLVRISLLVRVTDNEAMLTAAAELHGHPGESCAQPPEPGALASQLLALARADAFDDVGTLLF